MNREDLMQRYADAWAITAEQCAGLVDALSGAGLLPEPAPTDPRERALWAKQQRGTGPEPDGMRKRGRTTRYRAR